MSDDVDDLLSSGAPIFDDHRYERTTRGIRIRVEPHYLDDQSDPEDDHYVWAYTVRIENGSPDSVRLRTRHWLITDAFGQTEEVRGEGVVGEQPVIRPGEGFEYTSGAPLATPSGVMVGRYGMETSEGEAFEAEIPAFSLDSPHETRRVH
ncbi:MAG: Co2+/Mg2+ efflux protein ApaG [Pseudomonadota bacterium]